MASTAARTLHHQPCMRNVVGILLAAAVGIHCSAPTESSDPSSAPAADADQGRAQTPAPREPATSDQDPSAEPIGSGTAAPAFSPLLQENATTHVTSTVTDSAGASYATGTFEGRVTIGDRTWIQSRGDKDVFLLKIDEKGHLLWVRTVGSGLAESGPRVTLDPDSTHVHIVGITKGKMDCGSGPLPTWSSDTFFFCVFGGDGAPLSGGVFPTGVP